MKTVLTFVKNNQFVMFVVLAYLLSWWLVPLDAGMLPVGPSPAGMLSATLIMAVIRTGWHLPLMLFRFRTCETK